MVKPVLSYDRLCMHYAKEDDLRPLKKKKNQKKKPSYVIDSRPHRRYNSTALFTYSRPRARVYYRAFGKGQNFQNPIRRHVRASRPRGPHIVNVLGGGI